VTYPAGSFVVSTAQPKMGLIRYLLGRTFYPDNSYTRDAEGSPIRPYDMATDTMFEFMGVRVDPVDEAVKGDLVKLTAEVQRAGQAAAGAFGTVIDGRLNDAFRAVNLLLDKGVPIRRVDKSGDGVRAGDFIVAPGHDAARAEVATQTGADFTALKRDVKQGAHDVKRLRIGMYQRYYGGNMDEGWTRFLLEQFGFPYTSLKDAEIKQGNLEAKYDVIILPSDSTAMMTGEGASEFGRQMPSYPPEYRSGFGKEGVDALKAFVQKGGTIVTFGEAGTFAIERLGLPLRNVLTGLRPAQFFCPGSTLRATFDHHHPLGYGMPGEGLAVFLAGSQAYEIVPTDANERVEVVASYRDRDILESGWLVGGERFARKAAMVSVRHGDGRVVLIGFRPQHRAQTHGTYKLVFNALVR
jgi:hypothetical protein